MACVPNTDVEPPLDSGKERIRFKNDRDVPDRR
jgi:hypothetical protein